MFSKASARSLPANSGIGAEVAKALAAAGAKVGVNYVTAKEQADRVVAEIQAAGGEAVAPFADVSKEDQVQAMFGEMLATYGSIEILVNNAGLQRDSAFHEFSTATAAPASAPAARRDGRGSSRS